MKKKYFFILLIFSVLTSSIYYLSKNNVLETYESPDKKYKLEIIEEDFVMDNDVVRVKLKNANGKSIGSFFKNKCTTSYTEIEVKWTKDYVWYARGHLVYLKNGSCE